MALITSPTCVPGNNVKQIKFADAIFNDRKIYLAQSIPHLKSKAAFIWHHSVV